MVLRAVYVWMTRGGCCVTGVCWKVIQMECRWRDENKYGMQPSDKVFHGHITQDGATLVIHHNKRGDITLSM